MDGAVDAIYLYVASLTMLTTMSTMLTSTARPHPSTGLTKVTTDRDLLHKLLRPVLRRWPEAPSWLRAVHTWAQQPIGWQLDGDAEADAWAAEHHDGVSVSTASSTAAFDHASAVVALLCTCLGIPLSCGVVILGLVRRRLCFASCGTDVTTVSMHFLCQRLYDLLQHEFAIVHPNESFSMSLQMNLFQ